MNDATIPLSDLRALWRQARLLWYCAGSPGAVFRGYVREEIARRTIAELRLENERLAAELCQKVASIDAILGIGTRHLDGLTETELERYSQLSPPEMFKRLLAREAELTEARAWEPVPINDPAAWRFYAMLATHAVEGYDDCQVCRRTSSSAGAGEE